MLVVMQHDEEFDYTPWAIVVLDMEVIANEYLAERIEHFSGGAPIDYEMMIVENDGIDQVVYNPDPSVTPTEFQESQPMAEAAFFVGSACSDSTSQRQSCRGGSSSAAKPAPK